MAAVLAVNLSSKVLEELEFQLSPVRYFWSDSQVVLGYINNESSVFHVFVANRVQQIREKTSPSDWRFVKGTLNPADHASRGLRASHMVTCTLWWQGPAFLAKPGRVEEEGTSDHGPGGAMAALSPGDPEVRSARCRAVEVELTPQCDWAEKYSSWSMLLRVTSWVLRFGKRIRLRHEAIKPELDPQISADELLVAEKFVVRSVQCKYFVRSLSCLLAGERLSGSDCLLKLDPFVDEDGILRVGGRLRLSDLPEREKHPFILPKEDHVTTLVVDSAHRRIFHQGRGMTINAVRQAGFWVLGLSAVVSTLIWRCVSCRRLRGKSAGQKMAELPADRLEQSPPFTYVASDFFGPYMVTVGRGRLHKRYGVLFVCMASRAVHCETAEQLTADCLINCLRRFMAIRGPIALLRCDRGSNYVGMVSELKRAREMLDEEAVRKFAASEGCCFQVQFEVPQASHTGGTWERLVQSVKRVLNGILVERYAGMTDEMLRTFLAEAASIVNSRPLSTQCLGDPLSPRPLCPNDLLLQKCRPLLPPPGAFTQDDAYSRKRWRRVQHLVDTFWHRFRREYVQHLQTRSKWQNCSPNLVCGDIVLFVHDAGTVRNTWRLGRVVKLYPSADGLVRSCQIAVADPKLDGQGRRRGQLALLDRSSHQIVRLVPARGLNPDREP